jgi:hypothetical protein
MSGTKPARPLPDDDTLRQMRADLMSVAAISTTYGVAATRIARRLAELGLPRRLPSEAYARCGERQTVWSERPGRPPGWITTEDDVTAAHVAIGPYQDVRLKAPRAGGR